MRSTRILFNIVLLFFAVIVESVWLSPLRLPGAVPPLTVVVTIAIARLRTPPNAALIGFGIGLLADLVPPSTTPLGTSAFALCAVAFAASKWRHLSEGATGLTLLTFAAAAEAVAVLRVLVTVIAGVPGDPAAGLLLSLAATPIYALMLATVVQPVVSFSSRLVSEPQQRSIFR